VQAHDDETCLTIADDLGCLFSGIAEDDERLWSKVSRNHGNEFVEAFLGDRPPIRVKARYIEPRQETTSDRLDDMYEQKGQIQRIG